MLRATAWFVLNYSFFAASDFYKENTFIQQVAVALNTFLTANVLVSMGEFLLISVYERRHANHKVRGNFVLGIKRVANVINVVFVVVSIMIAFNINPKEFITSVTIVAMAIAVIFREYITNMISGLIVMFSDQFSIGDHIKTGTHQGKIVDITLANLVLKDDDDDVVLIPNNLVFTATLMNKSSLKTNRLVVKFELPLQVSADVDQLENYLKQALATNESIIWQEPFQLKVAEVGKDFIKFRTDVVAKSASSKLHKQIENEILSAVLRFDKLINH